MNTTNDTRASAALDGATQVRRPALLIEPLTQDDFQFRWNPPLKVVVSKINEVIARVNRLIEEAEAR